MLGRYYSQSSSRFINSDVIISKKVYVYTGNDPVQISDYNGMSETVSVSVNFYCTIDAPEGIHLSITIDGVEFSFGSNSLVTVSDDSSYLHGEDIRTDITRFIIDAVPIENAKDAVIWLCKLCRLPQEHINSIETTDSIYRVAKEKSWFGASKYPKGQRRYYKYENRPCAWLVEAMIKQMGFLPQFSEKIGAFQSDSLIRAIGREKNKLSYYYRAYEFLERWGYSMRNGNYKFDYGKLVNNE